MISIDSQNINLLVTPNHRCYVKNSFYGKFHWVLAKDLFNNTNTQWFKKTCNWNGKEQNYFKLPEIILNKPNKYGEKIKKEKNIPMETWIKFLGLFLSEGSCKANPHTNNRYRYIKLPRWLSGEEFTCQ